MLSIKLIKSSIKSIHYCVVKTKKNKKNNIVQSRKIRKTVFTVEPRSDENIAQNKLKKYYNLMTL